MNRSSTRLQIATRTASLILAAVLPAPGLVHAGALPLYIGDPTANEKPASGIFLSLGEGNIKRSLSLAAKKRWGNDYMHARYYSPNLGRFVSVDAVGGDVGNSQSWNRYAYGLNNPLKYLDPDGRANLMALSDQNATRHTSDSQTQAFRQEEQKVLGVSASVVSTFAPGPEDALMAVVFGKTAMRALGSLGRSIKGFFSKADNIGDAARAAEGGIDEGTKIFRVWGDDAAANGRSWTTVDPESVPNYRSAAGLPSQNSGRFVSEGVIQDATGITTRSSLPLDGNPGGLSEVLIPNPSNQVDLTRVSGANPPY